MGEEGILANARLYFKDLSLPEPCYGPFSLPVRGAHSVIKTLVNKDMYASRWNGEQQD